MRTRQKVRGGACLLVIVAFWTPAFPQEAGITSPTGIAQDDPSTVLRLAEELARAGEVSESADRFRWLVGQSVEYRNNLTSLAAQLFSEGARSVAMTLLEQYLLRSPDDLDVRRHYGDLLAFDGQVDAALSQYDEILEVEPTHLEAMVSKAKALSWRGELQESLRLFERALQQQPDHDRAVVGYGFALRWSGDTQRAKDVLRRALERDPTDPEVRQALLDLEATAMEPEAADAQTASGTGQVAALLSAAAAASNRGSFEDAARLYRQVLELEPGNEPASRQLARVLSWSAKYDESLAVYDEIRAADPDDPLVRLEVARVKSWAGRNDESIADYRSLLDLLGGVQHGEVSPTEVRLEMAKVMAWDGRYEETLSETRLVLESTTVDDPRHVRVRLAAASVFGFARRFQEALDQYEVVLRVDPDNVEAKRGKAQVLSWNRQYGEARRLLAELVATDPHDEEVRLLMANVELASGKRGRALAILRDMPDNAQVSALIDTIHDQMRPVLRLSAGYDDSLESPGIGPSSTLRVLRYTTSVAFSPDPDVRMELFGFASQPDTSNAGLARFGEEALSSEFLMRATFRPAPTLGLVLGAGAGLAGGAEVCEPQVSRNCTVEPTRVHLLYEVRPTFESAGFSLSLLATRRLANYTPLSIHMNVVDRREGVIASHRWNNGIRLAGDYWRSALQIDEPPGTELQTSAQGGSATFGYLMSWDSGSLDLYARFEAFGYDESAAEILDPNRPGGSGSVGVFIPQFFSRIGPGVRLAVTPVRSLTLEARGSIGPQRLKVFEYPPDYLGPTSEYGLGLSGGGSISVRRETWEISASYDFYRSTTPSYAGATGDGSYQTHSFLIGFQKRF